MRGTKQIIYRCFQLRSRRAPKKNGQHSSKHVRNDPTLASSYFCATLNLHSGRSKGKLCLPPPPKCRHHKNISDSRAYEEAGAVWEGRHHGANVKM